MDRSSDKNSPDWDQSSFGRLAAPKIALTAIALWMLAACAFHVWPGPDISIASFFHNPDCSTGTADCIAFPLSEYAPTVVFREIMHALPALIAIPMAAFVAWEYFFAGRTIADAMMRARVTLVLAFIAGPGIVANVLTKPLIGRPRPRDTDLFGGQWPYVKVGEFADYCPSNCSFVSGEASSALWLIALLVLVPAGYRSIVALVLVPLALAGAMMRMAFGAHYFSDTVLGGLATLVLVIVIASALEQARHLPPRLLKPWRDL